MKKKVILSFDYELFFGERSGTVLKSLIEPTNILLDTMESVGFRGNFFIDVLMIKYLRQNKDERSIRDLKLIEAQICDMVRRGHRIELHLHPHWVDAKYNGDGTWDFGDFHHYSLSSFCEKEIITMFQDGVDYLNKIGSEIDPNYRVCAFRAGGWAIQPFKNLKKAFTLSGIRIDSSSARGIYVKNDNSYYDFRKLPNKDVFQFEDDVCIEAITGSFTEVPISTYHRPFVCSIIHKASQYIHKGYNERLTDGTHFRPGECVHIKPKSKLYTLFHPEEALYMMSFSQSNPFTLKWIVNKSGRSLFCFIDHPKDFSKATCDGIRKMASCCDSILYAEL